MPTHLAQNQFITNSSDRPATEEPVAANPQPPSAATGPFSVSEGVLCSSLPSVEMEPSATAALAPSGTAVTDSAAAGPVTVETILAATRDVRALALSSQAALANGFAPKEMLVTPSPPEAQPSMTMEVPQRAPAGLAPNTAAPAGLSYNKITQAVEIQSSCGRSVAGPQAVTESGLSGLTDDGKAGPAPGPQDHIQDLEQLIGVAGKRRRRLLALPRFVPDEDAIEAAARDPSSPRALETDPVWADPSPLFLQR